MDDTRFESWFQTLQSAISRNDRRLNEIEQKLGQFVQILAELSDKLDNTSEPIIADKPAPASTPARTLGNENRVREALQALVTLGRPARCHEVQRLMPSVAPGEGKDYNIAQRTLQELRKSGLVIYHPSNEIDHARYGLSDAGRERLEQWK